MRRSPALLNTLWPLFAALGLLSGCSETAPPVAEKTTPSTVNVDVVTIAARPWSNKIHTYGELESTEEVAVSVDFSAVVKAVYFQEGETIEADQVLMELDDSKQRLRLARSEASVANARATLDRTQSTFERHRSLLATNAISKERYKQSEASFKAAKAGLEEALAAEALAQQDLQDTTIISPVNGVVVSRGAEPGQNVMPGALLARVQVVDTLRVVTYVTEREVNSLRVGDSAPLTTPGVPGRIYEGRIETIGSRADPNTGNFTVKLTVNNDDGLLKAGMSSRVQMSGTTQQDVLSVPVQALTDKNRKRVLYVVRDGQAREVEPILGISTRDDIPVRMGLSAGDQVIVHPLNVIANGTAVKVRNEQRQDAPAREDSQTQEGKQQDDTTTSNG